MSFHTLTVPFATPTLLHTVLADNTFRRQGYVWGFDGHMNYCFCNPERLRFEIWRKRWFSWWLVAALGLVAMAPLTAGLSVLLAVPVALVLPKYYTRTGKTEDAPVFSVGPQMRLPGNIIDWQMVLILTAAAGIPTVVGMAIGGSLLPGGPGLVIGAVVGAFFGSALASVILTLIGLFCSPFGDVVSSSGIGEKANPLISGTYHINRTGTSIGTYSIRVDNPPGPEGSGGLTPFVLNGAPQFRIYLSPHQFVVWGLIRWDLTDSVIREKVQTGFDEWADKPPQGGLVIVCGTPDWIPTDTMNLVLHKTVFAVACDGHRSALLGSFGECAQDLETHILLDPLMRYGLKMVPI